MLLYETKDEAEDIDPNVLEYINTRIKQGKRSKSIVFTYRKSDFTLEQLARKETDKWTYSPCAFARDKLGVINDSIIMQCIEKAESFLGKQRLLQQKIFITRQIFNSFDKEAQDYVIAHPALYSIGE